MFYRMKELTKPVIHGLGLALKGVRLTLIKRIV